MREIQNVRLPPAGDIVRGSPAIDRRNRSIEKAREFAGAAEVSNDVGNRHA